MKYILLALSILLNTLVISAQNWNIGIEAGFVHNRMAVDRYNSDPRNGFRAGAMANITLPKRIIMEAEIAFVRKGATITGDNIGGENLYEIKYAQMNYLQIPISVGYKINLGRGFSIVPQVGGYIAFATGGHSLDSGIDRWGQEYTTRSHIFDFTNENRDWGCQHGCKRLDGGFVFSMTGYYKHFGLRLGYDLGMTPVSVYGNGKHRTLYASVTYWLKKY